MLLAVALLLAKAAETGLAQCPQLYTFTGEAAGDEFGQSVSSAGDVDNDGYADVIVGAPYADGGDAGRAYVYSGRTGAILWTFTGETVGDRFGHSVSGAGDVNHDYHDDLIVGAYRNDAGGSEAGRAYVYSGQTGALLYTFTGEVAGDWYGFSVSGAGDVNHDYYDDLIVGAHYRDVGVGSEGRAYVYSGQTGGLLNYRSGGAYGDLFGYSVSGAGDVDFDGDDELIVGAPGIPLGGNTPGRAYVYSKNASLLHTFTGEAVNDYFGFSVSSAGDVNNDGYADVIIGALWNDAGGTDAGRAYVYSGKTWAVLHTFTGEVAGDWFGGSVSGAGDVDHDYHDDLIVGAGSGRAYVYSGRTGALLWASSGEAVGDLFGRSVSGAGDVNKDHYAELIVGARQNDAGGSEAGRAYVFVPRPDVCLVPLPEWTFTVQAWPSGECVDLTVWGLQEMMREERLFQGASCSWDPISYTAPIPAWADGLEVSYFWHVAGYERWDLVAAEFIDGRWVLYDLAPYVLLTMSAPKNAAGAIPTLPVVGDSTIAADSMYVTVNLMEWIADPRPLQEIYAVENGECPDLPGYYFSTDSIAFDSLAPEGGVPFTITPVTATLYKMAESRLRPGGFCACDCHADPQCDSVTNVLDVVHAVNVAFRGEPDVVDPNPSCPYTATDVDCSGYTDVIDVVHLVNVAFRSGNPATEFYNPCAP